MASNDYLERKYRDLFLGRSTIGREPIYDVDTPLQRAMDMMWDEFGQPIEALPASRDISSAPIPTVAEIHNDFMTQVDVLLVGLDVPEPAPDVNMTVVEKADRLLKLGFGNSKSVTDASVEVRRLSEHTQRIKGITELRETVEYFTQKYPQYKFITSPQVYELCEKYNLVCDDVTNFIGDVPDKNLEAIENNSVEHADQCYGRFYDSPRRGLVLNTHISSNEAMSGGLTHTVKRLPLAIVAPVTDFKMEERRVNAQRQIENIPKDPIVLQPVYHNGKQHYLIITAWGDEASDSMVVNEKMN